MIHNMRDSIIAAGIITTVFLFGLDIFDIVDIDFKLECIPAMFALGVWAGGKKWKS